MGAIVGIDLGTTNSLIGVYESGFPIVLADDAGRRLTPSIVHYAENPGDVVVGVEAARMRAIDPLNTIWSVKRLMGRRSGEQETLGFPYRVVGKPGTPVMIETRHGAISPEDVSKEILRHLKAVAERALDAEVDRAVITVPAYFNDTQRAATKRAGELAGFHVERILNEPTAAALAYGLDKLGEKSRIAVYDLGGGTFDISILELRHGIFEVLATHGNTRLGGDDIDGALCAILADRARQTSGRALPPEALARLRDASRLAKEALSNADEYAVVLPFLDGPRSFECVVFRGEIEALAQPLLQKTRAHCAQALADAEMKAGELDAIVLAGGMTRMPLVRDTVAEIFGQPPDVSQHPEEVVALGAAIQAAILDGALRDLLLLDVTPLSLGIETFGGLMNVIIPRNTTIPVKAGEMFTNAVPHQRSILVNVLQGERELAKDNWSLGRLSLDVTPCMRGAARVGVQFQIDENGILQVLVRDTMTGAEKIVELASAVDVSDEAVEAMIAESLDNAVADMAERRVIELRLKAEEMIPATRDALALAGDQLPPEERERISKALRSVEKALAGQEADALKLAVEELDAATQDLAALVLSSLTNPS